MLEEIRANGPINYDRDTTPDVETGELSTGVAIVAGLIAIWVFIKGVFSDE